MSLSTPTTSGTSDAMQALSPPPSLNVYTSKLCSTQASSSPLTADQKLTEAGLTADTQIFFKSAASETIADTVAKISKAKVDIPIPCSELTYQPPSGSNEYTTISVENDPSKPDVTYRLMFRGEPTVTEFHRCLQDAQTVGASIKAADMLSKNLYPQGSNRAQVDRVCSA